MTALAYRAQIVFVCQQPVQIVLKTRMRLPLTVEEGPVSPVNKDMDVMLIRTVVLITLHCFAKQTIH